MVDRYLIILCCLYSITLVASDSAKVSSFLQDITKKQAKSSEVDLAKTQAKQENTFLSGLSGLKAKQQQEQVQQKKDMQEQEQHELQAISYIKNFYGNSKYQAAMKILNDSTLQNAYQEGLNQINMFFFNYSQKVLHKYHAAKKSDDDQALNVTSFLTTLHQEPKAVKNASKKKVKISTKHSKKALQTPSQVTSFLASLKG